MKLQKETKRETEAHGRWYGDACGAAFAMELIGERWTLLIVRELMLEGRRFSDIRASLPGLSAKVLTERLQRLEDIGVLTRRNLPPPAAAQIYELTEWGRELEEVMQVLGRWSVRSPLHDPTLPLSPVSFILSLRTMYDPAMAGTNSFEGLLRIGDEAFVVRLKGKRFEADPGTADHPDFTLSSPAAPPLAGMVYGKVPVENLAEAGVEFSGDRTALARFIDLFHLPEKTC